MHWKLFEGTSKSSQKMELQDEFILMPELLKSLHVTVIQKVHGKRALRKKNYTGVLKFLSQIN